MSDVPDGVYRIRNVYNSEQYLDKRGDFAFASEDVIDNWTVSTNVEGKYCTITHDGSTPKTVLDLNGGDKRIGTDILVWGENGGDNQRWRIVHTQAGSKKFRIVYKPDEDFVVTATGEGTSAQCKLAAIDKDKKKQEWTFEEVESDN